MTVSKLRISIASPDEIRSWSYGEITKSASLDYRTFKPEHGGLLCERIFGPVKNYECHCGRYTKVKFKSLVCERCGVEVTHSSVRSERMGHIELAYPVCHPWYIKRITSPIALLLDLRWRDMCKVIYFASYIVTFIDRFKIDANLQFIHSAIQKEIEEIEAEELDSINPTVKKDRYQGRDYRKRIDNILASLALLKTVEQRQLMTEDQYRSIEQLIGILKRRLGGMWGDILKVGLGSAAIKELLQKIDLRELAAKLHKEVRTTQIRPRGGPPGPKTKKASANKSVHSQRTGKQQIEYAIRRLKVCESFLATDTRPEWMVMDCIPVLSPGLRPMIQLDKGGFATSDLNDLYRRVINRNNRIKHVSEMRANESIINHENRLLQGTVDALFDNGTRARPVTGSKNRRLKSLSDLLSGKEGHFRRNLLSKRVDYSGTSVFVPSPDLKLHQCGLPIEMALELFKPFLMHALVERGYTGNVKLAKRMIDKMRPEMWQALKEVVEQRIVLLSGGEVCSRAGVQAFEAILTDSKTIQINPLLSRLLDTRQHARHFSSAGSDTLTVHVPLTEFAKAEAHCLMTPASNLFSPKDGSFNFHIGEEIEVGCRYLTMVEDRVMPSDYIFASPSEAIVAFEHGLLTLQTPICVRLKHGGKSELAGNKEDDKRITVGRLLLQECLPPILKYANRYLYVIFDAEIIAQVIKETYDVYNCDAGRAVSVLESIQKLGFKYAMQSGRETREMQAEYSLPQHYSTAQAMRRVVASEIVSEPQFAEFLRSLVDVANEVVVLAEDCGTTNGVALEAIIDNGEVIETLAQRISGRYASQPIRHPQTGEVLVETGEMVWEWAAHKIEQLGVRQVYVRSVLHCELRRGVCAKCYGQDCATGKQAEIGTAVGVIAAQVLGGAARHVASETTLTILEALFKGRTLP